MLRCAVSSAIEDLQRLHEATGWTPSAEQIRPNPSVRARKELMIVNLERMWVTLADMICHQIFGMATTRGADGRRSAARPAHTEPPASCRNPFRTTCPWARSTWCSGARHPSTIGARRRSRRRSRAASRHGGAAATLYGAATPASPAPTLTLISSREPGLRPWPCHCRRCQRHPQPSASPPSLPSPGPRSHRHHPHSHQVPEPQDECAGSAPVPRAGARERWRVRRRDCG